jgi:hypothetical protein
MTCMTAFAEAMAMPTMQLPRVLRYRVLQHEDAACRQLESNAEHKYPHMNWIVVTDNEGRRQLRIRWEPGMEILTRNRGRNCNVLLTDGAHTGGSQPVV